MARSPIRAVPVALQGDEVPSFARRWEAARARGADRRELVRIAFDHHHAMVFATARRILDHRDDAEDAVQGVFERLARALDDVREPERIAGFLKTTAIRHCLRVLERRRWWSGGKGAALARELGDESLEPADASLVVVVRQLLGRLPPAERVAIVAKFVEQLSLEEVALAMETSVSTVRRRIASARARLAALDVGDGDAGALVRDLSLDAGEEGSP
jgi:RNA polymerase sigma-70 factor (ECF subfamily)